VESFLSKTFFNLFGWLYRNTDRSRFAIQGWWQKLSFSTACKDLTPQTLAEYIYLGDQLLSMIKPGETVYYFHNDHLGTPQVLTNDSQTIAWKAVYTPFGDAVASIQTVENPFRFPGQYYDPETGLHYNYFRYYNPQTGRYITPDPIGLEGGINLFSYAKNNPLKYTDPFGLMSCQDKCELGCSAGGALICGLICVPTTGPAAPICYVACGVAAWAACKQECSQLCQEESKCGGNQ
jgi:RHS repeat-associated protein